MKAHDRNTAYRTTDFDVLIIGGGLTGLSLACALKNTPLRMGMVSSNATTFTAATKTEDIRSIALSYISKRIFQGMMLWDKMKSFATPIKHIHISNQGSFGFTRLSASASQVEALGFVVDMAKLTEALSEHLSDSSIEIIHAAEIENIEITEKEARITLPSREIYSAKLLVVADGGHSHLRESLSIPVTHYDYQQTAIVTNVGLHRTHQHVAYERFTEAGPLALLPLNEKMYALVFTVWQNELAKILELSDADFLQLLQDTFGYRLGKFIGLGQRQTFPLKLMFTQEQIRPHTVFIGNASHTLHPIAGQGFNLALRDVAGLAQLIHDDLKKQRDIGSWERLQQYAAQRKPDHRQIITFTDTLIKLFANDYFPLNLLRNIGLIGLDLTIIKNKLARRTMGYNNYMPDLTLGLSLQ